MVVGTPREDENVGVVVQAATPVYAESATGERRLLGVVSTDISVDELAAKLLVVPNSKRSRSYAFLLDLHGRALAHPQLRPSDRLSTASAPDISSLEVPLAGIGFEAVRQAMALAPQGLRTISVRLNGGESEERTYFWKPAGGPFIVVYSLAAEDATQFLADEPLVGELVSYYYRYDLYDNATLLGVAASKVWMPIDR